MGKLTSSIFCDILVFFLGLREEHGEGNGTPLQSSCLENPMDRGAWWAAVHGVSKSWAWLSDFTFTFHFHALEKEMATHSSVLAWRIPGTEEPGGLLSMGSHRVGHDWSDLAAAAVRNKITVLEKRDKDREVTLNVCYNHGWCSYDAKELRDRQYFWLAFLCVRLAIQLAESKFHHQGSNLSPLAV